MGLQERFKKWLGSKKQGKDIITEKKAEQLVTQWEKETAKPMIEGKVYGFSSEFVSKAEQFCQTKSVVLKKMTNWEQKKNAYNEAFDIFSEDYSLNYSNAVYDYNLKHKSVYRAIEESETTENKKQVLTGRIETSHNAIMAKKAEFDAIMQRAEDTLNEGYKFNLSNAPVKK